MLRREQHNPITGSGSDSDASDSLDTKHVSPFLVRADF